MNARKIAYNTAAQIGGKFLGFFVSSFTILLVAAKLGTEGMGAFTTVTALVTFFVTLADLGVNVILARELVQQSERREQIISEFLGFRLAYSLAAMLLAPLIAVIVPAYRENPLILYGVGIIALSQFVLLINQIFVGILQSQYQLDRASFAELVNRVIVLGGVFFGATHTHSVPDFFYFVAWTYVVSAIVNALLGYLFARGHGRIVPTLNVERWKTTFAIVMPMGVFTLLGMVHFKADTVLLSLMKPIYDVGIYGYGYKMVDILLTIPTMFTGVILPRISQLYEANDQGKLIDFLDKSFESLAVLTIPLVTGIYILAPYLTVMLSRQSVHDGIIAGRVLQILAVAMLFWFFESLFSYVLVAGKSYFGLIRNMVILVVINLALNLIFIPQYSYWAAATTSAITAFLMLMLSVNYCRQTTGFRPKWFSLTPIVLSTIGMGLIIKLSQIWHSVSLDYFGVAGRWFQLETLLIYTIAGTIGFVVFMLLWGKRSPLYVMYDQVTHGRS